MELLSIFMGCFSSRSLKLSTFDDAQCRGKSYLTAAAPVNPIGGTGSAVTNSEIHPWQASESHFDKRFEASESYMEKPFQAPEGIMQNTDARSERRHAEVLSAFDKGYRLPGNPYPPRSAGRKSLPADPLTPKLQNITRQVLVLHDRSYHVAHILRIDDHYRLLA
jgi:hypothetical protein